MATFSVSDAVGSGFRLIGRRPFSVFFWGLAYLVLSLGPTLAVIAYMAPDMGAMFAEGLKHAHQEGMAGAPFDPTRFMGFRSRMMLFQPVLMLSSLVSVAVLTGAVFRAVLERRNSGFAYLRLGAQEFWLALLRVAMGFLAVLLLIAIAIPVGGITAAAFFAAKSAQANPVELAAIVTAGCLIGAVLLIWIVLRFSLAAPMTFAEREFRLFESWTLTKGQAWKLFGLLILLLLIMMGIELALGAVSVAVVFATMGAALWRPEHVQAFFDQPVDVWARALAPWAAVGLVIMTYLTGALSAIFLAPWASVYQQLTESGSPPPAAWMPAPPPPAPAETPPVAPALHDEPADHHAAPAHAEDAGQGHEETGHAESQVVDVAHGDAHAEDHHDEPAHDHAEEAHDGEHHAEDAHGEAAHVETPHTDEAHGDDHHAEAAHDAPHEAGAHEEAGHGEESHDAPPHGDDPHGSHH